MHAIATANASDLRRFIADMSYFLALHEGSMGKRQGRDSRISLGFHGVDLLLAPDVAQEIGVDRRVPLEPHIAARKLQRCQ